MFDKGEMTYKYNLLSTNTYNSIDGIFEDELELFSERKEDKSESDEDGVG